MPALQRLAFDDYEAGGKADCDGGEGVSNYRRGATWTRRADDIELEDVVAG
jgi:hypothetical protein